MKSNVLIAYNAFGKTNANAVTMKGYKQGKKSKRLQIMGAPELQAERNKLRNSGVFKATSRNAMKQKTKVKAQKDQQAWLH